MLASKRQNLLVPETHIHETFIHSLRTFNSIIEHIVYTQIATNDQKSFESPGGWLGLEVVWI